MTGAIDFAKYWGVRITNIKFDCNAMSLVFDLFWTTNSAPRDARLRFNGVSKINLVADKIFDSDVVELVSLEGTRVGDVWQVVGELSNYDFALSCSDIIDT